MRILHLVNHLERVGNGIVNVAVDLACVQSRLGHDVAVASGGGTLVSLLDAHGVFHYSLPLGRNARSLALAPGRLGVILRRFQSDIVHAHMISSTLMATFMSWAGKFHLVTHVHNEWQSLAIVHGLGARVIVVSEEGRHAMNRRGIPYERLRVVRNGTLGSPRLPSTIPSATLMKPAVLTVAGLLKRKGIADLISAFHEISCQHACYLYIAGEGPDRAHFESIARAGPGADRIQFLGFVPDPRGLMAAADIFVLASHEEPGGLVLAEAREQGVPIIASRVGGIPEMLDGGVAGILVPPKSPSALAAALGKLVGSPEDLGMWSRNAKAGVKALNVERAANEVLAVYSELCLTSSGRNGQVKMGKVGSKNSLGVGKNGR